MDLLSELPMPQMASHHLMAFFRFKPKRNKNNLNVRKYLHFIRLWYNYDTSAVERWAMKGRRLTKREGDKLPSVWSDGKCWFLREGQLVFLEVGKKTGKYGLFGF